MAANAKQGHVGRPAMDTVIAGFQTKSDKIRELAKAGYSRAEIADFLGVRYQFVRNVLVNDERVARRSDVTSRPDAPTPAVAAKPPSDAKPDPTPARIEPGGRITVPAEFLMALGLNENDPVVLSLDNDSLRVMSLPASVRRVQTLVRRFIPEGLSLVDELMEERRAEAKREDEND